MFDAMGQGRFVSTPELTPVGETVVSNFSLAVNRSRRGPDGTRIKSVDFFDYEIWDTAARTLINRAKKGDSLVFRCEPRQHKWETPTGDKKSRIVFRITEFTVYDKRNKNEEENITS
jgi:single-stranded DNA-binding protein